MKEGFRLRHAIPFLLVQIELSPKFMFLSVTVLGIKYEAISTYCSKYLKLRNSVSKAGLSLVGMLKQIY